MLLFCPPRSEHRQRCVGESCSPLPSTPRAHLAASPLSLYLVIVQDLCAGAVATDQRAHLLEDARAWRASPRVGLGRVLPPQRVGVRLPLLWGRQIGTARLGLNCFLFFTDGVRIESESQEQCEWMYRMFSHHSLPSPASWCFTLLSKELPALLRCLTTGNSDRVSKRLLGIFMYLTKWNPKTQTLPPPEPIELRAMICCGLTKEMLPLPTAVKIHPAFDFLKILLAEAEIVPEEALYERPVFKVYGQCDECQRLLRECPTKKDVGLGPTEVMYVMMPAEWSQPVDWSECEEGFSERA